LLVLRLLQHAHRSVVVGAHFFAKGLVTWVESMEDRRVRIIALTPRGNDLILSAFRKHSGQMRRVFSEPSAEELHTLEVALKKVGEHAAALIEQRGQKDESNGRT
jgi:hypothetical protein